MNALRLAPFVACLLATDASAFCVYNKTSASKVEFIQSYSNGHIKGMHKTLSSGGKECCHYSNRDCNYSRNQTEMIDVAVLIDDKSWCGERYYSALHERKTELKIEAGGAMVVQDNKNDSSHPTKVSVYLHDGKLWKVYACPSQGKW
jgi:hypothetical protein